ncbi:Uu.00g054540.m01.CDS01 [Anthostomella pinea]|uniref:Uu.00g054540.m01.CDS01 n=1 Tax=Anthostomella pinea TaxID=933095 RepID=A0AAI8YPI5_9PEZI|nr:Uu.00g054540.m01.CDS01 [Anthostomella pinea]
MGGRTETNRDVEKGGESQDKPPKPGYFKVLRMKFEKKWGKMRSYAKPWDTSRTIDTQFFDDDGKPMNPLGYHTNGLIGTIRLFQLTAGLVVLIASSAISNPISKPFGIWGVVLGILSGIYAAGKLLYRHVWKWYFMALEIVWFVNYVVCFFLSQTAPVSNPTLLVGACGISIVLWALTMFLDAVWPFIAFLRICGHKRPWETKPVHGPKITDDHRDYDGMETGIIDTPKVSHGAGNRGRNSQRSQSQSHSRRNTMSLPPEYSEPQKKHDLTVPGLNLRIPGLNLSANAPGTSKTFNGYTASSGAIMAAWLVEQCVTKERECVYKPSRRGGPRIRKKSRPLSDYQDLATSLPEKAEELSQDGQALPVENYIEPGAGLKPLVDVWRDSDAIYDHLFQDPLVDAALNFQTPMARTYGNDDRAILNAYYIWIHPYFPILPAPEYTPAADQPMSILENERDGFEEPSSPISLALSAILALIPSPQDPSPLSDESVRWRRTYSQFLAKSSLESIESESERPESSVEPPKALDDSDEEVFREQFHPQVPLELESIIALDLLSVYEYAQRGNLKKMKARAGSALVSAMSLFIHTRNDVEDGYSEARRRVWWMTYICVCQGSIVSNTPPTFEVFASSFTAKYPNIQADSEAWPLFVQAQQAILAATQFVIEFNRARKGQIDMGRIFNRMRELERLLEPLITKSESYTSSCSLTQPMDKSEATLAHSLRCMSRIKLNSARIKVHRYCAFFDLAVFSGKHCDLTSTSERKADSPEPRQLQSCCTTTLDGALSVSSLSAESSSPRLSHSPPPHTNGHMNDHTNGHANGHTNGNSGFRQQSALAFPFTTHHSSKICLRSAFNIAEAFDFLPYPNPTGQLSDTPLYLGPGSTLITPRTMPAFACCAMQCSYALLMVKDRTESAYPFTFGETGPLVDNLRDRLQQGLLSVLVTLDNYATAFEALGGMRDQIRDKVDLSLGFVAGA